MFPLLSNEIQVILWQIADQDAPRESVGLLGGTITPFDQTEVVFDHHIPLTNEAADPTNHFTLYAPQVKTITSLRQQDNLLCLWHSHPDRAPILSEDDQTVMWALKIPMLVVSLSHQRMVMYTYLAPRPSDGKRPLVEWGSWRK